MVGGNQAVAMHNDLRYMRRHFGRVHVAGNRAKRMPPTGDVPHVTDSWSILIFNCFEQRNSLFFK